jgi:nucleoside-diphosphate kinase
MTGKQTFTMIKPDAMTNGNMGNIIQAIEDAGFSFKALKLTRLTMTDAMAFYEVHHERPFYNDLCEFMSSGPILAAVLEKENAVEDFRKLIGATDPTKAEEMTIRKRWGTSVQYNAVHGSDSDENAVIEGNFFFSTIERQK